MATLQIRKYPDPVLRKRAQPLRDVTDEEKRLIKDMIDTMRAAQAVGLAANQVGVAKRVIVFNASAEEWKAQAVINPVILKRKGSESMEEGCLSLPGITEKIRRYNYIVFEGLEINGKRFRLEAKGLAARIIQHEVDHLNGKMLIDRINPLRRIMALRRFKRNLQRTPLGAE